MQSRGFDPARRYFFSVEGIFFFLLESTWALTPFQKKKKKPSFGWEFKPRSSLCIHAFTSHGLKRSLHSCPRRVNTGNKNTPTIHETDYLNSWIKNGHYTPKSRDIAGKRRRRRRILLRQSKQSKKLKKNRKIKERRKEKAKLLWLLQKHLAHTTSLA